MAEYGEREVFIPGMISDLGGYPLNTSRCAKQDIKFGYPVMGYLGDYTSAYNYKNDTAKIVWDGDFVTSNTIDITVNGVAADTVTFDTSHDDTMDLVLAAVTALTVADPVLGTVNINASLDSTDTNNRTLLIHGEGLELTVTENVLLGAGQASGTITYSSDQVFLGIATFRQKEPSTITGLDKAKWNIDEVVSVAERHRIWGVTAGSPLSGGKVYINSDGKFATSGTEVTTAQYIGNKETNADLSVDGAPIDVHGSVKLNAVITWS